MRIPIKILKGRLYAIITIVLKTDAVLRSNDLHPKKLRIKLEWIAEQFEVIASLGKAITLLGDVDFRPSRLKQLLEVQSRLQERYKVAKV